MHLEDKLKEIYLKSKVGWHLIFFAPWSACRLIVVNQSEERKIVLGANGNP